MYPDKLHEFLDEAVNSSIDLGRFVSVLIAIFIERHLIAQSHKNEIDQLTFNGKTLGCKLDAARANNSSLNKQIESFQNSIIYHKQIIVKLQSQVVTLSPESLQKEIDALKKSIESKEFELELSKNESQKTEVSKNALQARINDLERYTRYLKGLLRQSGTQFNEVCGHGEGHLQAAA